MAKIIRRVTQQDIYVRDVEKAVARCGKDNQTLALLVVQVDQLEKIEGTLGYKTSQAVADRLGRQIQEMLRGQDQILKVSDRKFWVMLYGPKNEGHAVLAANKVGLIIRTPFRVDQSAVKLECCIGIALYPEHATEPEELVRRADLALAAARDQGAPHSVYSADGTQRMATLWNIESELDRALEDSELVLYYQPKIDLQTFMPCGAEALLRWNNPTRGLMTPDVFLPIAEKTGKLEQITHFVLNAALRQRAEWPAKWGDLGVSINVPPILLESGHLVDTIKDSMRIWGSKPEQLTVEVTEDSLVRNPEVCFAALESLCVAGIRVSIDDFGTGYSSLSHFKNMPADELKIDKSFVFRLLENDGDHHIVRMIVELAHTFGISVVAEGIESEEMLNMLIGMECDVGQGYLYSAALPQDNFIAWIEKYKQQAARVAKA